jgi:hypothetical protein
MKDEGGRRKERFQISDCRFQIGGQGDSAKAWVADNLHVVVGHSLNHYFPVHSSAHGPPRGLCLTIRREIHQILQLSVLEILQRAKQQRVRLLERLLEQRSVQRRLQPGVQVEVKVEIQARTRAPTQVAIQVSIRRKIRPGMRGEIGRETER